MLQKFSFAGVSTAAIALAFLCPSPARALSFNWTFTSNGGNFIGPVSGTIDGLIDNSLNNNSNNPSMTATVTSDPFNIGGTPSQMNLNTYWYSGGSGILVNAGVVDTTGLQLYFSGGSQQLNLENPNGNSGTLGGYYYYSNAGSGSIASSSDLSVPVFTAVPAPLPLLGLGAATAFSRKLKQRIAVKRKREEVG